MFNSKNIGNRIGFGCWSSYCGNRKQQIQNSASHKVTHTANVFWLCYCQ